VDIPAAQAYARKHELHALVVSIGGHVVHAQYGGGYSADRAHALYSGTKSFWGIAALEAVADDVIALDDPIDKVVPDFHSDERSEITPRMLLQMTAGYGFGGLGNAVPTYEKAIGIPLKGSPGSRFTYSGIPLQVFGAYFARALAKRGLSPHEYLEAKVLRRAGVVVGAWRTLSDGTCPLPTGAQLAATSWLAYGTWVMRNRARYAQAFEGSRVNPRYGLCWWLGAPGAPTDVFYASGSGGQGLYVVPSLETIVVHFGKSASYKHDAFLRHLLGR
jgi:CubicO group peptidase (beta-lactamase class C family)